MQGEVCVHSVPFESAIKITSGTVTSFLVQEYILVNRRRICFKEVLYQNNAVQSMYD